jgi:hypothetical protein
VLPLDRRVERQLSAYVDDSFGLRIQPIDATNWLKRSAGVS